jgi:hypothetical protein
MWNTTFMMTWSCLHAVDLGSTLYLSSLLFNLPMCYNYMIMSCRYSSLTLLPLERHAMVTDDQATCYAVRPSNHSAKLGR